MLKALNTFIDRLETVAMVAFMSIATIITSVQVVYRYGFNSSLFWAEEVVIYSIICMSFVGASMGVRYGAHISVDVLNAIATPAIQPLATYYCIFTRYYLRRIHGLLWLLPVL